MGLRYRKSINLGGGFRINISKSGIGYSWGVKGYRITKTAKGRTRTTASIPGTGISYVHETGRRRKGKAVHTAQVPVIDNNHYDTRIIENNITKYTVSEGLEDILATAKKAINLNKVANVGFWVTLILGFALPFLFILTVAFIALKIYVKRKGIVILDYTIDDDQQAVVDERINPMIKITQCAKVWRITQSSTVINKKYSGGASSSVMRTPCKASTKAPFPFKTNSQCAVFKYKKEAMIFLPDKLFVISGTKIGALNYSDISTFAYTTRFHESQAIPKDAQVIGHTWQYVNKSGGPDKRFSNNRQIPICLYGEVELKSAQGLNTEIMFSNPNM